jgi:hypothetical protein
MQSAKYPVSGLNGDLTRVGVIGVNIGMGPNVEFQIEGVAQNVLSINSRGPSAIPLNLAPGANSTNDTGDFTLWAKFKLRNETERRSVSWLPLRRGFAELKPGNRHRFESDQRLRPDFSWQESLGKTVASIRSAILELRFLPRRPELFSQNDVFTYGAAGIFRINKQFSVAGEVNGRANTRPGNGPLGTESQSEARLGMQIRASGLRFDFAGTKG